MTTYLVFTLHAPIAAFGGIAVGERRPGWDRPARSAIVGLLAGALGIDRADDDAQLRLDRGYGIAIRTDASGRVLADFHTAQVPPAERKRPRLPTRAAELVSPRLETVLTRRVYRTDALHMVALWALTDPPYPLDALATALNQPAYVPYVGRKSCPLGLPLRPAVIEAVDALSAFAAREATAAEPERQVRRMLRAVPGTVALDADAASGVDVQRIEQRRDRLASRVRWQFALREEAILRQPASKEAG